MLSIVKPIVIASGFGRIAIGLAPFVAAKASSRMLGFPADHDNPTTRLMARMFGVRDIGLGLLAFYGACHPEVLPVLALFQAAMDVGDLVSMINALVRRQGIDRAAWASSAFATVGALSWLGVWLLSR